MTGARLLVIQHDADTPMGELANPLVEAGLHLETWPTWVTDTAPWGLESFDGVLSLGSVESVRDEQRTPWIRSELSVLEQALESEMPILGVCFGAQALARAGGGRVIPSPRSEIGWHPVDITEAGQVDSIVGTLGKRLQVMHYHFDTFELPTDEVDILGVNGDLLQAYRIGAHARGIQFHIEANPSVVYAWMAAFADDMASAGADLEVIRRETKENWQAFRQRAWDLGRAFAHEVTVAAHQR